MSIYYIVYKTTNLINNKIYIGAHKSNSEMDSYLGSGVLIRRAIKKYGRENFIRENLFYCDTEEEMYLIESILVNEEYITRDDNYNVELGGFGINTKTLEYIKENNLGMFGWSFEERSKWSKVTQANRDQEELRQTRSKAGKLGSKKGKENKSGIFGMTFEERSFYGKRTSEKLRKLKLGFFNSKTQSELGKRGGVKNKGSLFYNDGVNMFKYNTKKQKEKCFSEFLKENPHFIKGRLPDSSKCSSKKWVNNGTTNKRIDEDELEIFLEENKEFCLGKTKCNGNTKFVTNGIVNKRISIDSVNDFLDKNKDFRLGVTKSQKSKINN